MSRLALLLLLAAPLAAQDGAVYHVPGGPLVHVATKAAAIDALALAFEQRVLTIIPDPVLVGELQAFEMERLPSGMFRYGAPSGMHDDTVMALAMAWQACAKPVWYFAGM